MRLRSLQPIGYVSPCHSAKVRRYQLGRVVVEIPSLQFDLALANVVGNAVRYGAPPVKVTAASRHDGARSWLDVTVTDCGPGLPADALPHVFERFYKADAARTRSDGSGLGLAIALENVRLHGGTLLAANRPAGGAMFTMRLPMDTSPIPGPGCEPRVDCRLSDQSGTALYDAASAVPVDEGRRRATCRTDPQWRRRFSLGRSASRSRIAS